MPIFVLNDVGFLSAITSHYGTPFEVHMDQQPLLTFPALEEGILIKRYKRFLADVELKDGQLVTAHCANTGPMKSVLHPGNKVRLRHVSSTTRKLEWTWEQAQVIDSETKKETWVGVNTSLPNKLIRLAIEQGFFNEKIGAIQRIQPEVTYGVERKSRIDLLLTPNPSSPDPRLIYLEVKNTTWKENDVALFPDTETTRGKKHLNELISVLPTSRAILVPCLSRNDVNSFAPGDNADREYGELFRKAMDLGVEIIPCAFEFYLDKITWEGFRLVRNFQ